MNVNTIAVCHRIIFLCDACGEFSNLAFLDCDVVKFHQPILHLSSEDSGSRAME
jgi:hypothetical protein